MFLQGAAGRRKAEHEGGYPVCMRCGDVWRRMVAMGGAV